MAKLKSSPTMNRSELEAAASAFFRRWVASLDRPRGADDYNESDQVSFDIECSKDRIEDLEKQLISNAYDGEVTSRARDILEEMKVGFDTLPSDLQLFAQKLSGRAERTFLRQLIHQLSQPYKRFESDDDLFEARRDAAHHHSALRLETSERRRVGDLS